MPRVIAPNVAPAQTSEKIESTNETMAKPRTALNQARTESKKSTLTPLLIYSSNHVTVHLMCGTSRNKKKERGKGTGGKKGATTMADDYQNSIRLESDVHSISSRSESMAKQSEDPFMHTFQRPTGTSNPPTPKKPKAQWSVATPIAPTINAPTIRKRPADAEYFIVDNMIDFWI